MHISHRRRPGRVFPLAGLKKRMTSHLAWCPCVLRIAGQICYCYDTDMLYLILEPLQVFAFRKYILKTFYVSPISQLIFLRFCDFENINFLRTLGRNYCMKTLPHYHLIIIVNEIIPFCLNNPECILLFVTQPWLTLTASEALFALVCLVSSSTNPHLPLCVPVSLFWFSCLHHDISYSSPLVLLSPLT